MSNSGRSIQKWGLCSEGRHGQNDLPKAASSCGGSALFSTPSHTPSHWPGHLRSLLPHVSAGPAHQGPGSHGCLSASVSMQTQGASAHESRRWHKARAVHLSSHQHLWPWCNRSQGMQTQPCSTKEQSRHAGCNNPTPFTLLSPIPYSHLPADGTHYMFDLSTTQVHNFQSTVNENGTYSVPACFMGGCFSLIYLTVRATISAGSVFQGKPERWGDDGQKCLSVAGGAWCGLQGGWDSHLPMHRELPAMPPHHHALRTHPTAEVVLRKGPWVETWPMRQVPVKEDHPSQAGGMPAQQHSWLLGSPCPISC